MIKKEGKETPVLDSEAYRVNKFWKDRQEHFRTEL